MSDNHTQGRLDVIGAEAPDAVSVMPAASPPPQGGRYPGLRLRGYP
jgi:hypothetical protein